MNKLIIAYYGIGEGKTSAALGHVIRAAHYGKVAVIHFMKGKRTGEDETLRKIKNVEVYISRLDKFLTKENQEEHKEAAQRALMLSEKLLKGNYFLIVLDEILYAFQYDLINEQQILDLIKKRNCHVILTGGKITDKIIKILSMATEFSEKKHHYKQTKETIKGIDF